MIRSRWIKAVVAALVSTGMALGQQAAPTSPAGNDDPTGRIISVNEPGKPVQKCRVIKAWNDDKGQRIFQVESIDTGEMLTVVVTGVPAGGSSPSGSTLSTLIFRWGKDRKPPAGTPMPPDVVTVAAPQGATSGTPRTMGSTTPPPLMPASVTSGTSGSSQSLPLPSGNPRIVPASGPTLAPSPGPVIRDEVKTVIIEHGRTGDWRQSWGTPEIRMENPGGGRGLFTSRGTARNSDPLTDVKSFTRLPDDMRPIVTKVEPLPSKIEVAKTETSKRVDTLKADTTKKVELPKLESPKKIDLSKVEATKIETTKKVEMVKAEGTKVDLSKKKDLPALSSASKPAPLPSVVSAPLKTTGSSGTSTASKSAPVPSVEQAGLKGGSRPIVGARSVTAAGVPASSAVPVVQVPDGPPPRPHWQVPQAPQIPRQMTNAPEIEGNRPVVNAFTPAESIPPSPYSPLGRMTSNAFSSGFGIPSNAPAVPAPGVFGPPPGPPMPPVGPRTGMFVPGMPQAAMPYGPQVQVVMNTPQNPGSGESGIRQVSAVEPSVVSQASPTLGTPQLLQMLREALYPSQREEAADKLGMGDARKDDMVVKALCQGVKEDPAASVRAGCLRALGRMKATGPEVTAACQAARADQDARVRQQAEDCLASMTKASR